MRSLLLAVLVVSGCSSFDEDVFPKITSASVTASAAAPGALAAVDITIDVVAGSRADHTVALREVRLDHDPDRSPAKTLDLAFPGDPTLTLHAGDHMTLGLVNVGTTNADVLGLCGQALDLSVMLAYADPMMDGEEETGDGAPIAVACQ
jgi:hypothetical protein